MKLDLQGFSSRARIGLLLAGTWLICVVVFQPWKHSTETGAFRAPTKFVWDLGSRAEEPARDFVWWAIRSRYTEQGRRGLDLANSHALALRTRAAAIGGWSVVASVPDGWVVESPGPSGSKAASPGVNPAVKYDPVESGRLYAEADRVESEGVAYYSLRMQRSHDNFNPLDGCGAASVALAFLFFAPYAATWVFRVPPAAPAPVTK